MRAFIFHARTMKTIKIFHYGVSVYEMNTKWFDKGEGVEAGVLEDANTVTAAPSVERGSMSKTQDNMNKEKSHKLFNYVLNDEDTFKAFLRHRLIEIDNNAIERCFRHIAMGRRTWLFTGSHRAAENLTFMYSLEESCKMNGLDFGTYIEYVLERMVGGEKDTRSLLPNHVKIPLDWVPESKIVCPSQKKIA